MHDKPDALKVDQRIQGVPYKIPASRSGALCSRGGLEWVTHPLAVADTVPTRSSHPNARSWSSAGLLRHRAAKGTTIMACTNDTTWVFLHARSNIASWLGVGSSRRARNDAPPVPCPRAQGRPFLLADELAGHSGRDRAV